MFGWLPNIPHIPGLAWLSGILVALIVSFLWLAYELKTAPLIDDPSWLD